MFIPFQLFLKSILAKGKPREKNNKAIKARIYFTKYKSSCWLVFFKISVLQSFSKYFETLWCFIKFSVHHKWNDAQLLLIMISKYLLVLKASSRRLQDMSWRCFQNVFSVAILRLPRHLKDILKTSWKTKKCYAEDVLKTSSWHLGDKQNFCWEYLYATSLNLYLINLYLTYLYLTNQGESKMH